MNTSEDPNPNEAPLEEPNIETEAEISTFVVPEKVDKTKPSEHLVKVDMKSEFAIPELPAFIKLSNKNVEPPEKVLSSNGASLLEDETHINTDSNTLKHASLEKSDCLDDLSKSKRNTLGDLPTANEKIKNKKLDFPYHLPNWAGTPIESTKYSLSVLKDGAIRDKIDLSGKSMLTFGRLPDVCDVFIEHPSCSRFHAVLQYCTEEKDIRKVGYYLYDLGSTHGSYVNKEKVKAKVYVRVRVGYQIKFGGSSRLYIVEGPEEDQEVEIDMEEVRQKRIQHKQSMMEGKQKKSSSHQKGPPHGDDDDGVTWGFREDAEEEELDLKELMERKKNVEVKDPKKTLNGFFEREGIEFDYEISERGRGNSVIHIAQVRLPIESSFGVAVIAEGTSSNKRDAVLNCATDACKLIQAYDMMQNTCKEDQRIKRQRELEENDFYDSDDDNYLDRTGSVEKKRLKRKQMAGKSEKHETETHESLKEKVEEKMKVLFVLEEKLNLSIAGEGSENGEDVDSLDVFMSSVKNKLDKKSESQVKREITGLKNDIEKLKKLVEKTKPALPAFTIEMKIEEQPTEDNLVLKDIPDTTVKSMNKAYNHRDENAENQKDEIENVANDEKPTSSPKKKKRTYGPVMIPTKQKDSKKKNEADFVEWLPPENQTGDGRTHLNDKLGY